MMSHDTVPKHIIVRGALRTMGALDGVLKYLSIFCFIAIALSVFLQVFSRFILPSTPSWTEEVSRYCFIYLVASAIGLAWRDGDIISLDLYQHRLGPRGQSIHRLIMAALTGVVSLATLTTVFVLVQIGRFQSSPALGLPMKYVYFAMFLLLANLAFHSLREAFKEGYSLVTWRAS
jgi:TRAP-type C4-dicarboxylate transport system permease small subunit